MKYLLIAAWFVFATAYLIIERTLKVIATIFIFCWDFKYRKENYLFWETIDFFPSNFSYSGIKNFYKLKDITAQQYENENMQRSKRIDKYVDILTQNYKQKKTENNVAVIDGKPFYCERIN